MASLDKSDYYVCFDTTVEKPWPSIIDQRGKRLVQTVVDYKSDYMPCSMLYQKHSSFRLYGLCDLPHYWNILFQCRISFQSLSVYCNVHRVCTSLWHSFLFQVHHSSTWFKSRGRWEKYQLRVSRLSWLLCSA